MKWAFRNKTAEKRLKMAIFKLLILSYMLTTLYISFFYSNNITLNMRLVHFKILIFYDFSSMGVGLEKES